MPAFFDLLCAKGHPAIRAVLGHFIFVYLPYMDGNDRMVLGFLMNIMMAGAGRARSFRFRTYIIYGR